MPLLYLDATGNYSDPASTNYKYLRADSEWAAPDSDHEFYDASGGWSTPELVPDLSSLNDWNDATWAQIDKFGQQKVIGHAEDYTGLLHVTKSVPLGDPVNKSIDFEIVDICHTDWGSDHAFVWMPKTECLVAMAFYSSEVSNYGYSQIHTALMPDGSLFNAFPTDLKNAWKEITYKYLTRASDSGWSATGSATSEKANLVIPSIVEVALADSTGKASEYNKEGTSFPVFSRENRSDRIRRNNGYAVTWWLRSLSAIGSYGSMGNFFAFVLTDGNVNYNNVGSTNNFWVCPCFAV